MYYGESIHFNERIEDHKGNVRRHEYGKSAIARHVIRNRGHTIVWENSKLIMKENNNYLRKIKEGLIIQQTDKPLMNIDKGLVLSNGWKKIVPNIFELASK